MKKNKKINKIITVQVWIAQKKLIKELKQTKDIEIAKIAFESTSLDSPEEILSIKKQIDLAKNLTEIKNIYLLISSVKRLSDRFYEKVILKWLKLVNSYEEAKEIFFLCINNNTAITRATLNKCKEKLLKLCDDFYEAFLIYRVTQFSKEALIKMIQNATNYHQVETILMLSDKNSIEYLEATKKISEFLSIKKR